MKTKTGSNIFVCTANASERRSSCLSIRAECESSRTIILTHTHSHAVTVIYAMLPVWRVCCNVIVAVAVARVALRSAPDKQWPSIRATNVAH